MRWFVLGDLMSAPCAAHGKSLVVLISCHNCCMQTMQSDSNQEQHKAAMHVQP